MDEPPILFFDGVCNLCNHTVDFILRHEREPRLRFAPLQGEHARRLLPPLGIDPEALDSLVLYEAGRVYQRSAGAFALAAYLRAPWCWLRAFRILPRAWLDALYRYVAARRYRWFGQKESCRLPTPEERARFLD
ncbi:MAG: DCC1-like thiol-disulfide oxidoreductase family protein [Verrucomicrobiota bacterium JB022]|nr:DCC1-like thiol-disulfide oxidoreductase family protein [Verrucomicrobiota bacterium JB022]